MRAALPGGLAAVVDGLTRRLGAVGRCAAPSSRRSGDLTIVDRPCDFANGPQTVRTTWTSDGRLVGLFVLPAAAAAPLPPGLHEEAIVTGAPDWPLPGSLAVPSGTAPSAIAVLVHGSGPNDRDETIGPNKPFRDLAWGLGTRGIATLRYDKRTRVFGARFAALPAPTLDDEVVDDAVAALASASERVAGAPLFVVGHSEGALLARGSPRRRACAASRSPAS